MGDESTAFFHRMTEVRNSINSIRSFTSSDGTVITCPNQMSHLAVTHFQQTLAPCVMPLAICPLSWLQLITPFRVLASIRENMISLPSSEEISSVLMKLNANKAPGPDGLSSGFYKSTLSFIGKDFIKGISHFFKTGFLPSAANATILSLVPKRPGASSVADYRPISCCTTIYKVISKLLVKHLRLFLPDFILQNQTTFVKGRLLVENTLLVAELVKGYHKSNGKKKLP